MKKRASDLKAIKGHRNFYRSYTSEIIYYKDKFLGKFSTGEKTILRAKAVVAIRKESKTKPSKETIRKFTGEQNPFIEDIYFEMLEKYKSEWSPATLMTYRKDWNNSLEPFFGKVDEIEKPEHLRKYFDPDFVKRKFVLDLFKANESDEDPIQEFKDWYLKYRGTLYAKKVVIHLGVFCKYLLEKKIINRMPDLSILNDLQELVTKRAKKEPVGRFYSAEERKKLLDAARTVSDSEEECARAYLMVNLGVYGLRKESEGLAIPWEKVRLDKREFDVWSTKNSKWRTMPMTEQIYEAFAWQHRFTAGVSKFVFPRAKNRNLPTQGQVFDRLWWKVKEKSAIKDWNVKQRARFHDLRHSFASVTAEEGWPPKVACDLLDMSMEQYDKTYAKTSSAKRAEMMEKSFGKSKNMEGKR